ncbi:MAG: sulfatase [Bacteroidales bacterium]|nr:sulfatase [Bacteroidales bacterium]
MKIYCVSILMFAMSICFAQEKPNIVFILADDCTKWDIACYGSKDSKTPTIDKLASEGMKFTKCYQAAPMCSPTRHNLYTGMYPVRTGAHPNHTFAQPGVKSIVDYLKPLGYRVALSGKRHILPDEIFSFEYLDGSHKKETNPDFNAVEKFIGDATSKKENFCLFLCSTEPHTPWNKGDTSLFNINGLTLPPNIADTKLTRKQFRNYLAEINYLDGQVKQALDLLEKYKLSKNTVVFFASEQGNNFPHAKWTCYNAGLSSALIVRWPGVVKPGSVSDALIEYSDLTPTFIDIAGGDTLADMKNLDGSSLVEILEGHEHTHKDYTYGIQTTRGIYSGSQYYPIRSVSDGTYRLILNLTPDVKFLNSVNNGGGATRKLFKEWLVSDNLDDRELANRYINRPAVELFNDEMDPYNLNNLANDPAYKEIQESLTKELNKWMEYCGDEGIKTELLAYEHMRHRKKYDNVQVHMQYQKAKKSGNFSVNKTGYYTFSINGKGELFIDNKPIVTGVPGKTKHLPYGIIGLEKGYHQYELKNTGDTKPEVTYKGPSTKKKKL